MTKVSFFSDKGQLKGFQIQGHSGYAQEGYDIVCAGVSSAAYMTANTITEIFGIDAAAKVEDGFMSFLCNENNEIVDRLIRGFKLHITQFCGQYPDYITIEDDKN